MNAGKRNQRITLQRPVITTSADGSTVTTWETVANLWAGVTFRAAGDSDRGNRMADDAAAVFEILHRADVTPAWRLLHRNSTWHVLRAFSPASRRDVLQIEVRLEHAP